MRFRVLGPMELLDDGRRVSLGSQRQRAILAALLIHAGDLVTFDRLVDILWGPQPPASARASLHSHVSRLRKVLAPESPRSRLHTLAAGYLLEVGEDELDAARFADFVQRARGEASERPEQAVALLDEALALWRGPPYIDVADEEFARAEVRRLDELRLAAVEDRIDLCLALGHHAEVVGDVEALVADHPLRERPRAQLMLALYRCGRSAEALDLYRRFRERLVDEVGLDPSESLQQLERDILQHAPELAPTAPLERQVRRGGDRASARARRVPPSPASSLIGRDSAVDSIASLLQRARVVTLMGPGGVGKTRLAQQVAERVSERFVDGVSFSALAPVREPEAVSHVLATTLGITPSGGRVEDSLVAALWSQRLLLVLDNCEHVLSAAGDLITLLTSVCPHLTVLATSRERLAVEGEHLWPVPPLQLPHEGVHDPENVESVRLFCERAAAIDPSFELSTENVSAVSEVCCRLDGLPLAIELAAARVRAMPPRALLEHLGQRLGVLTAGPRRDGGRHRTLRATIDWSYGLLSEEEALLFDRFSVFAGGFTLDAATRVCGQGMAANVGALAANLVDKSMVVADRVGAEARYALLETLREYGAQQLQARGENAVLRARHAAYYMSLAEDADEGVRGAGETHAVAVLDRELDNLRAAHRWAVETRDAGLALRLCTALHAFAIGRLRDEVFSWTEAAVQLPQAEDHGLCAVAYGAAAEGVGNRGELTRAVELAERGLALAQEPSDVSRLRPLSSLAVAALYEGRLADCCRASTEAASLAKRAGDTYRELVARLVHGLGLIYAGKHRQALRFSGEQRHRAGVLGNPTHIAWAHYLNGEALLDDDPEQATVLLEQAVDIARSVDNRFCVGVSLVSLTSLRARHGESHDALRSFRSVVQHWRRAGDWTHQWTTLRNLIELLARIGRDEEAAVLLAASSGARRAAPPFGTLAARLAALPDDLRSKLGEQAFGDATRRGAAMSDDQAVGFALETVDEDRDVRRETRRRR